jgi:uridine monophosphate synthetase
MGRPGSTVMKRSTVAGNASDPVTSNAPDPLLDALWERGLILLGDRVMEEYALQTPIFIDLRHKLYDDIGLLSEIGAALHRKLVQILALEGNRDRRQQVIGIPDTATPLALATAMAARSTTTPLIYSQMRKQPAAYPGGEWGLSSYMGTRDPSREITLIDDVMASGRTKLWAMEELKKDGLEIKRILVVVDREQGGDEILADKGLPTHSLYRASEMIAYYRDTGKADAETARRALDHLRAKRFR